jgi:hypothetical protein
MMEFAWTREIEDIAREFNVDLHTGLTDRQFRLALQEYGKNGKISFRFPSPQTGPCRLPLKQLADLE